MRCRHIIRHIKSTQCPECGGVIGTRPPFPGRLAVMIALPICVLATIATASLGYRSVSLELSPNALQTAARQGDVERLRSLLASGLSPRSIPPERRETPYSLSRSIPVGFEALFWAAAHGHTESVRLLVTADPQLNAHDIGHALYEAARHGHLDTTVYLLGLPFNFDPTNDSWLLIDAVMSGNIAVVQALVEAGWDPIDSEVFFAVLTLGNHEMLDQLYERGTSIALKQPRFSDPSVHSGLDAVMMRALIETAGGFPEELSYLLSDAIVRNKIESVRIVLETGYRFDERDGHFYLWDAISTANPEMVRLILDTGVDPAWTYPENWTTLEDYIDWMFQHATDEERAAEIEIREMIRQAIEDRSQN